MKEVELTVLSLMRFRGPEMTDNSSDHAFTCSSRLVDQSRADVVQHSQADFRSFTPCSFVNDAKRF